jgi:flagellar hook-associated protein FlgK
MNEICIRRGCSRVRRKKQRYCEQCHRVDQRLRKMRNMSEAEILARAVKKLNGMLRNYR